jgi:hypothetical protein
MGGWSPQFSGAPLKKCGSAVGDMPVGNRSAKILGAAQKPAANGPVGGADSLGEVRARFSSLGGRRARGAGWRKWGVAGGPADISGWVPLREWILGCVKIQEVLPLGCRKNWHPFTINTRSFCRIGSGAAAQRGAK